MMTKCDRCGAAVVGAKICFKCMFDLAEEESMILRKAKLYRGFSADEPAKWLICRGSCWKVCDRCWPFDCGCNV